jgi:hypothetical protein
MEDTKKVRYKIEVITKATGVANVPRFEEDIKGHIRDNFLGEALESGNTKLKIEYEDIPER